MYMWNFFKKLYDFLFLILKLNLQKFSFQTQPWTLRGSRKTLLPYNAMKNVLWIVILILTNVIAAIDFIHFHKQSCKTTKHEVTLKPESELFKMRCRGVCEDRGNTISSCKILAKDHREKELGLTDKWHSFFFFLTSLLEYKCFTMVC